MVCSPARCMALVNGIMARRRALAPTEPRPVFVWEPVPDLCTPEELERLREATTHVDVVSPNADEFAAFFPAASGIESGRSSRRAMVEILLGLREAQTQIQTPRTALVVREGAGGCTAYVGSSVLHLHAYHRSRERVRDPTGGGNTFLGALAIALTGTGCPSDDVVADLDVARSDILARQRLLYGLVHATVAASYAIEQTGMPALSTTDPDSWNGELYPGRFRSYWQREKAHVVAQVENSVRSGP